MLWVILMDAHFMVIHDGVLCFHFPYVLGGHVSTLSGGPSTSLETVGDSVILAVQSTIHAMPCHSIYATPVTKPR